MKDVIGLLLCIFGWALVDLGFSMLSEKTKDEYSKKMKKTIDEFSNLNLRKKS